MKTPLTLLTAAFAVLLVAPAGCSSKSDDAADTPEGACEAYAETYCARSQQCNAYFAATYTSLAQCNSHRTAACKAEAALPGSGLTPTYLNECRAALGGASCDVSTSEVCPPLRGARAAGQPCAEDTQCSSGSCSGEGDLKCGTCRPGAELGQACSDGTPCVGNLHCKGSTSGAGGSGSTDGTCVARLAAGSKCGPGDSCASPNSCRDGVCSPYPGKGQPCTGVCASGLTCTTDLGSTTGTCTPTVVKIAQPGESCLALQCAGGGECRNGICTAPLEIGSTCSASTGSGGTSGTSYPDGSCGGLAKCVNGTCQIRPFPICN